VCAGAAVRLGRVGAGAARRIADAGDVALIERAADDRVGTGADARLAGVALRAGAAVVAGRPVWLVGVGAGAARRVADAGVVALFEGGADDGVRPDAGAGLAGVALGAGVAVAAGRAVGLVRVGAGAVGRITGAGVVTLIERSAEDGIRAGAGAGLAGVGLGAGVAVAAGRAVGLARVGAGAGLGIAASGVVALVEGGSPARRSSDLGAGLAGVALRAGVAVAAGGPVGLVRVGAAAVGRVAGAGAVALIEGG